MTSAKPLAPIDRTRLKPVIEKISTLTQKDLDRHGIWKNLANLSARTTLTGIEAHPEGVYQGGSDTFEAVATVFLTLNSDRKNAFANAFPAHIVGTVSTDGAVTIQDIKVDTSSLDLLA